MKPFLILLVILSSCLSVSQAQESALTADPDTTSPPHKRYQSLELAVGYYSFPQVSYIFWTKNKERELYTAKSPNFSGPFNIAFCSFVNKAWEVSVAFGIDKIQGRLEKTLYVLDTNGNVTDTVPGFSNYSSKILSLIVCGRYHWKRQGMTDLYSGFGAGLAFVSNDSYGQISTGKNLNTYLSLGFQLTFIGIRYGGKYGAFAEAGFGSQGAIHGGLSIRF